jgi:retinol dehydrogenase 12
MGTIWSHSFLPEPTLTGKNLPNQTSKVRTPHSSTTLWHSPHSLSQPMLTSILQVHIVTGGYTGIGFELAQILYSKNSTVYIAGRSSSKGTAAIPALKVACPHSQGRLEFPPLDLANPPTISKSAAEFTSKETRLDVLTNNTGVMVPPAGSTTAQGFEL